MSRYSELLPGKETAVLSFFTWIQDGDAYS